MCIRDRLAVVHGAFSKSYEQALIYALEALHINKDKESLQNYLTVGDIYRQLKMNDSAQYYLDRAATSDNIYIQHVVHIKRYIISIVVYLRIMPKL